MRVHLQLTAAALAAALSAPAAADDAAAKAAYDRLCSSCHGADGKGNPAMVQAFGGANLNIASQEVAGKKDDELIKIISDGKGKMPAAGKSLTPADQQALVAYIRSLPQ